MAKKRKTKAKRRRRNPDPIMLPVGLLLNPSAEVRIPPWAWLAGALTLIWAVKNRRGA